MSRRIARRLVSGQDVCLFCAFRSGFDTATRATQSQRAVRGYNSSAPASSAASAAVAREREDEDDSPMLRQNSNLIGSFPTRQQNGQPPLSEQKQPNSSQSFGRSQNQRNAKNGGSAFSNNFGAFARRDNPIDLGRAQGNRSDKIEHRRVLPRDDGNRNMNNRIRQIQERSQFRTGASSDRSSNFSRTGTDTRRFVPSQDYEDDTAKQSRSPTSSVSKFERGRPRDSQDTLPAFRRVSSTKSDTWTPMNETQRPQRLGRSYDRQRSNNENVDHQGIPKANKRVGDEVEIPIGTPVGPSSDADVTDVGSFQHRRLSREDKRKPRSSRFEEEDDQDSVALPASTHFAPKQRMTNTMRTKDFDFDTIEAEEALFGNGKRRKRKGKSRQAPDIPRSRPKIKIIEHMSVAQLAKAVNVSLESFIQRLEEEGWVGARYDQVLPAQDSSMIVDLYGFDPVVAAEPLGVDLVARPPPEDVSVLPPRPPIVTIMGHVDHGKTTILDYLRKSSVVASEHGGITQHIGAFSVTMPGTSRQITFLDTPGHAAFLEMRRRGANVTDIVVLVVAADDSVKPQTIEAIKHAIEARVQIIVAINKVDKEDANIERVKQDLTRHEIVVEDYGGDFQAIPVSGKTGQGMAELEEAIITLADVYDFRAEVDGLAEGTIIESRVTAAGRVATVLVRRGTLRPGDFIVAGHTWARVRTLRDDTGALVDEAPPGTPVQVDGWRGEDPTAGLEVLQAEDEEQAKDVVDFRLEQRESARASADMAAINDSRSEEAEARAKLLAWEAQQEWARKSHSRRPKDNAGWVEPEAASGPKQVHFIVKADVAGSVEAVAAAVAAVGNNEIIANVIHSGTGQVTESDIRMLATTGEVGYAISFNQPIEGAIYRLAEESGLQILDHNIIYKVTDAVKEKLADELPPLVTQKVLGEAEVGQVFDVTVKKVKVKIAGCRVTNGTVSRANKVRVLRAGSVIYTGTLHSLKNVKKDVTEMRKGTECGMGFEDWEDFQEGDQVQCFEEHEEKRTLY